MTGTRDRRAQGAAVTTDEHPGELWTVAAEALVAWRAGDQAALDRLVRTVTPVLWQLARAYGLESHAAEEVVQASWLQLVRNGDRIREPQATLRWLTTTTRREAWRYANAARRERPAEPDELDAHSPPAADPAALVQLDRTGRALWQQLGRLTERCQRLLRVIAFEDRPDYATLSTELGLRLGSIGPTRRRCLDRLRALLIDDPEWSP